MPSLALLSAFFRHPLPASRTLAGDTEISCNFAPFSIFRWVARYVRGRCQGQTGQPAYETLPRKSFTPSVGIDMQVDVHALGRDPLVSP